MPAGFRWQLGRSSHEIRGNFRSHDTLSLHAIFLNKGVLIMLLFENADIVLFVTKVLQSH